MEWLNFFDYTERGVSVHYDLRIVLAGWAFFFCVGLLVGFILFHLH